MLRSLAARHGDHDRRPHHAHAVGYTTVPHLLPVAPVAFLCMERVLLQHPVINLVVGLDVAGDMHGGKRWC